MKNNHPRGLRNNNPLNIIKNKTVRWLGETNCESERTFCTFSSMTFGLRAALPGECLEPAVTIRMNGLISRSEIVHQLRQIIMKFTINLK
jgi:hypothetical protein